MAVQIADEIGSPWPEIFELAPRATFRPFAGGYLPTGSLWQEQSTGCNVDRRLPGIVPDAF
jgi:hypothetical protein